MKYCTLAFALMGLLFIGCGKVLKRDLKRELLESPD